MSARTVEGHTQPCVALERVIRPQPHQTILLPKMRTLVNILKMEPWLTQYSRPREVGSTDGSRIPFTPDNSPTFADKLKSARECPDEVSAKLEQEVRLGRIAGPFIDSPFHNLWVSSLEVVPKREHNKFKLIHHLSFPKGSSVNDGIDKDKSCVHYRSFDKTSIREAGKGALMSMSDIQSALRLLSVHRNASISRAVFPRQLLIR